MGFALVKTAPAMSLSDRSFMIVSTLLLRAALVIAGFTALGVSPLRAQTVSTWKGGDGNWSDGTKWTGGIPNSPSTEARVDGGNAAASTVTLDGSFTVGALTLSDHFIVADGSTLTIDSTAGFAGAGTLGGVSGGYAEFTASGNPTRLFVIGDVVVTRFITGNGNANTIITGASGARLTLDDFQTSGFAVIGDGKLNIVNKAALYPGAATTVVIEPLSTFEQTSTGIMSLAKGTMRLAGNGAFTIAGTVSVYNNFGNGPGLFTRDASSTLTNFDAVTKTLTGGSWRALALNNSATIQLNVGPILINNAAIELGLGAVFSGLEALQSNVGSLTLNAEPFTTAGAFSNSGTLSVANGGFTATGPLTNTGSIELSSFNNSGSLTLMQGMTQTAGSLKLGGTTALNSPVTIGAGFQMAISGGRLEGGASVSGQVVSDAVISPFTRYGQFTGLTINNGSLTLTGNSALELRAGVLNQFNRRNDSVTVNGPVALAGRLVLRLGSLSQPPDGTATFTVLSSTALSGVFANVSNGERLRTADAAGSFLVSFGPGAANPNAVVLSDFVLAPPRILGRQVPGEPEGTVFGSFGAPTAGPFDGSIKVGKVKVAALFAGDGSVRVRVGQESPIAGANFAKLSPPSGDAALATIGGASGTVPKGTESVLLAGLTEGPVRIAARTGTELTDLPGVTIKKFGTIDGNGSVIFFLATLNGGDLDGRAALCAASPDGRVRVLVSVGESIGGSTVKTIATLVGVKGELPEGRWRAGDAAFLARLTLADKSQALYFLAASANPGTIQPSRIFGVGDMLQAPLAGAVISGIGLPAYPAKRLQLKIGAGGVTKKDDVAILRPVSDFGDFVLAREGQAAPGIAGATFKTLSEPVQGLYGGTAFTATLAGVKNGASIWWAAPFAETATLLARAGAGAPGGGQFATFGTLVAPDGNGDGTLFTAKLKPNKAAAISSKNNTGLWASDSQGVVSRLLIAGQTVQLGGQPYVLKSFVALVPAKGSIGAARGYDTAGRATVLGKLVDAATGKEKVTALLDVVRP